MHRKKSILRQASCCDILLLFCSKWPRIKVYELKEANHLAEIELNTTLMTNMELQECISRRGGTTVLTAVKEA